MIFVCLLVFIAAGDAANDTVNRTKIDGFGNEIFNEYNENAETFQTGVLVRLDDGNFLFGNVSDPIGLSCTEGYMRPVVLHVIRSTFHQNIYRTQVVMKNLTIFYKDCRVSEESDMFMSAPLKTPCFLTIDISAMICWALVRSKKLTDTTCQNSIDMDLGDGITGAGTVRLFFLRSSTLYTFSLVLDGTWAKKIQEAVSRTSLVILSDNHDCMNLPTKTKGPPTSEITTHRGKGSGQKEDSYDDSDSPGIDGSEEDNSNTDYVDEEYDWEFLTTEPGKHKETTSKRQTTATTEPYTQLTTTTTTKPCTQLNTTATSAPYTQLTNTTTTKPSAQLTTTTTTKSSPQLTATTTTKPSTQLTTTTTPKPSAKLNTTTTPKPSAKLTTTKTTKPSTQLTTTTTTKPSPQLTTTTTTKPSTQLTTTTTTKPSTQLNTTATAKPSAQLMTTITTTEPSIQLTTTTTKEHNKTLYGNTTITNQSRTELAQDEEVTTNQSRTELDQDEIGNSLTTDHTEKAELLKQIIPSVSTDTNPELLNVTNTKRDQNENIRVPERTYKQAKKRKRTKSKNKLKKPKSETKKQRLERRKEKKEKKKKRRRKNKENIETRSSSIPHDEAIAAVVLV